MRILIVNHYAGHPSLGMEFRPFYLADQWRKKGHQVEILASDFSHLRHTQPDQKTQNQFDGIPYHWISTPTYKGNGIARIINILVFLLRAWLWGHKKQNQKWDIVIASSTYPYDIFLCRWLAKKNKAKLVFEVHDLWPLTPMELGGYSKRHPFIATMQFAENYAYKKADSVVSILPKTLPHMESHGLNPKKFKHIPNGIVRQDWQQDIGIPEQHQQLIDQLKQNNQFLVGYAGGLNISNNMNVLLEAAKRVHSSISFVIIGQGTEQDNLIQKKLEQKLDNVHFLPPVKKQQVPSFLKQMDATFISLQNKPIYRFGIGLNKIFDYMMAAKPIIFVGNPGNQPILEAKCGIEIKQEDPEPLAEAIENFAQNSTEALNQMGENGKTFVLKNHDYEKLAEDFLNFIKTN